MPSCSAAAGAAPMTEHADTLAARASPHRAAARAPTASAGLVRALVLVAQAHGVPPAVWNTRLGAHATRLDDPEHRVPSALYGALLDDCIAASGDPAFALHLGAATRVAHLGLLGFVLQASRTLGEALAAYERWQRTLGESLALQLTSRGTMAWLTLVPADTAAASPARIESMLAGVHAVCADLAGRPLPWRQARLAHASPTPALARLLGVPAETGGRDAARLTFDAAALAWPVQHGVADPALAALLQTRLAQQHDALGAPTAAGQVESWLRRHLSQCARPRLEDVAAELHRSPRALQTRLQAEGTSFRALADGVAREAAEAWLRQGQRVAEVSHALGFAEEAAFFRAFRRWTGRTPAAVQRAGRAPSG